MSKGEESTQYNGNCYRGKQAGSDEIKEQNVGEGVCSNRHHLNSKSIPTLTKSGLDFALAAESRSIDSACILRNRSLRSVFCAMAWNI